jgi:D-alanyl-D-alanine dipeptidase
MKLVDIRPLLPEAIIDLRYTTGNNVLGYPLHSDTRPLLEETAAKQLAYASKLFVACSLIPVIWDVHRTKEVQEVLLDFNSDPRYVLPADESGHVKGTAVDMTLAHPDGTEVDMGSFFDDFSEKAHADTDLITPAQKANRRFMARIMSMAGFAQFPTEFWHFDFKEELITDKAA